MITNQTGLILQLLLLSLLLLYLQRVHHAILRIHRLRNGRAHLTCLEGIIGLIGLIHLNTILADLDVAHIVH